MFDMVYPETLFTIRPSSTATKHDVTVESYPPNLVTANTSDGVHLYLQYNLNVVDQVAEGDGTGVILTLPEEQLLYVRVRTGYHAQILPGFTNLSHLQADTRATLTADCSSLTPSSSSQEDQRLRLDVTVKNDATMYLKSTNVGAELDLSGGAVMIYQGNVMGHRNVVESHARLYLQGTILPGAETQISSSAIATIDGDIRGHVTADDWAIVELVTTDNANVNQTNNSITGTIQARNAASSMWDPTETAIASPRNPMPFAVSESLEYHHTQLFRTHRMDDRDRLVLFRHNSNNHNKRCLVLATDGVCLVDWFLASYLATCMLRNGETCSFEFALIITQR
ncbi:expressed unknown protein [Seminavis robusta]|uniref:Uncharacterized protein n=1 Tax=Seminavis robusta TaxID=568900 RepID=A0A9N8F456_9STRA|nr:expressed unknown protein [Seminavis robusta]|eukprot:Sro3270_g346070.1 n/a (339) ;mRNA; r:2357-3373